MPEGRHRSRRRYDQRRQAPEANASVFSSSSACRAARSWPRHGYGGRWHHQAGRLDQRGRHLFPGYKPLTDEAIIEAKPDVILMMKPRDGAGTKNEDLMKQPALALTPAVQNKAIIRMDGLYLLGFRATHRPARFANSPRRSTGLTLAVLERHGRTSHRVFVMGCLERHRAGDRLLMALAVIALLVIGSVLSLLFSVTTGVRCVLPRRDRQRRRSDDALSMRDRIIIFDIRMPRAILGFPSAARWRCRAPSCRARS